MSAVIETLTLRRDARGHKFFAWDEPEVIGGGEPVTAPVSPYAKERVGAGSAATRPHYDLDTEIDIEDDRVESGTPTKSATDGGLRPPGRAPGAPAELLPKMSGAHRYLYVTGIRSTFRLIRRSRTRRMPVIRPVTTAGWSPKYQGDGVSRR
jgi:hypothetical protein